MNLNAVLKSKWLKVGILSFAGLFVLLLVFALGLAVGYRKAMFSSQWSEGYRRNFAPPPGRPFGGPMMDFGGREFVGAHGVSGQVLDASTSTLIIQGDDGTERSVDIGDDTSVMNRREAIDPADLRAGDYVVVIGAPCDDGRISAKLIRVMPAPRFFQR